METEYRKTQISLYIGIGFLLFAIAIEFVSILLLNNGLLVYTLDDPYIHMALSENLRNWHYGININEFSAPSSSILWPFIIMPFSDYEYAPFIINVAASVGTVFVIIKTLSLSIYIENYRRKNIITSTGVILFILATNIIGLIFTGMEHSLQVLIVLLVAYGLIVEVEKKEVASWFLAAVIFAPLIRYECLAISIAAVVYFLLRGYLKQAIVVIALIAMFLGAFSFFLISLGLDPLPTSVLAKSSVLASGDALHSFFANIVSSLYHQPQGRIMSVGALVLLSYVFFAHNERRKHLAIATIIAASMHFIAGHYGWYYRYEIYILAFMLLVTIYIYGPTIKKLIENQKDYFTRAIIVAAGFSVLIGMPYIYVLFTLPIASNNIYEQQYQMHRFVVDYYKKPVAVNDLGYVSYKNDYYVLDLCGLGSKKAFLFRTKGNNSDWIKEICEESNIGLAMIYKDLIKGIPNQWIEIGKLRLSKRNITPARSEVFFYATSKEAVSDIVVKLNKFIKTLPDGVEFVYKESNS